jgi:WD40 repeat protein
MATGLPGRALLGSRTGWIKIWDLDACATTHTFRAHDRQVLDIVVSTERRQLVSAGRDNAITIWNLDDLSRVGTLQGWLPDVDEVAVSPDAKVAYSILGDTIVASDVLKLSHIGGVSLDHQITVIAVSSDGSTVAAGDESGIVHFLSLSRDA